MHKLIDDLMDRYEMDSIPSILDRIKTLGFKYATQAGITWGIDDIKVPEEKKQSLMKLKIKQMLFYQTLMTGFYQTTKDIEKILKYGMKQK